MSIETMIGDVEAGLVRLIRYGLGFRYTAANLTALAAITPGADRLVYVTGSGLFEWVPYVTTSANGSTVIAATGYSAGRWIKVVSTWTLGAGGTPVGSITTGPLTTVEAYSSDEGTDAALDKCIGTTPSVLVQFTGDSPQSISTLPGTFYKNNLTFKLLILTTNLRGKAAGTQGSISGDTGAYPLIGSLRRLLCGVSTDSGIDGVERIEIGGASLVNEDAERRSFCHEMQVTVRASFSIDDEDLDTAWGLRIQPEITDFPAVFDAQNYVASGGGFTEALGVGLSRTIAATVAKISGVAVAADELVNTFTANTHTYRDLTPAGAWVFTAVAVGAGAPALVAGRLRVAVTTTDSSSIVSDRALCSLSVPFGSPIDL
jgi:phage gp37-like protein